MDSASQFEDEILALNPEHDLIFSKFNEACSRQSPPPSDLRKRYSPNKMKIITKMNQIIGQKPIGELPTHSDWDEHDSIEKETIALMRKFGLEQSVDRPPDESRTISTIPTSDDVIIMRNGHKKMSIFMSDSFFELKPRTEPTFCTEDINAISEESIASTSEISDATNLSSKTSSEITSSNGSDVSSGTEPPSNVQYKNVSSDNSNDSSKTSNTQSDLSWRRRSPTSSATSSSSRNGYSNVNKRQPKNSNKVWGTKNRQKAANENSNTNWRASSSKPAEEVKPQQTVQQVNVEKVVKIESKIKPKAISNCGSPLYKPKDLFLKKKAMLIQEVLSAHANPST